MKVFISQPMKDKTDEEILTERNAVIDMLVSTIDEKVEILDSFFKDAPHDAKPLWYLGESIKLLGQADVCVFCDGWEHYNGCTIEHECAVRYEKEIMYV